MSVNECGFCSHALLNKVTCAYFDLGYVLSDLFHRRTRSDHVNNGCMTRCYVLLIPRVTQAWNTYNQLPQNVIPRQKSIVDIGGTSATVHFIRTRKLTRNMTHKFKVASCMHQQAK